LELTNAMAQERCDLSIRPRTMILLASSYRCRAIRHAMSRYMANLHATNRRMESRRYNHALNSAHRIAQSNSATILGCSMEQSKIVDQTALVQWDAARCVNRSRR
jgi:hypothetical protein